MKAPAEGQSGIFGSVVKQYIEETSASITTLAKKPPQLSEISNFLISANAEYSGSGGGDNSVNPSTVQENSILAYMPVSADYIEDGGFKSNRITEYTVQPGDLISFIASDFGVSINSILWANNIKDADTLKPGQILRIPPVTGVIYKVQNGDNLEFISKKYSAKAARIMAFNDLKENETLEAGDELIIPDGTVPKPALVAVAKRSSSIATVSISRSFSHLPDLDGYFFLPTHGFNWGRIHSRNGVDVANSCGTAVYASADGKAVTVDGTGWNGGFGKYIKLTHPNGTETLYGHLSKINISAGEFAARGQLIGLMGTTGRSTGCHLHFEVHGARNPLAKNK